MSLTQSNVLAGVGAAAAMIRSHATFTDQKPSVIIIGGGSAGAVLASRLSEDSSRYVLLIDAGPDFAPKDYPSSLADAGVVGSPDFDWKYQATSKKSWGMTSLRPVAR